MRGWFDLFRENGGPTLYAHPNRTSVIGDLTTITLITVFATLYIAFFVVFPGMRKERFTTFLSVTLSLFVGATILVANNAHGWHEAEAEISSSDRAFSKEKIRGKLGVFVGLDSVNITLSAMPKYYNSSLDVNFNERFRWNGPSQLKEEYRLALIKGLPFPILTVAEYLAVDSEGFCWGRNYREAGYYTSIFLWSSFITWFCMNLLFVIVPRYGAYMMTCTGLLMLFSIFIYWWLLPMRPLIIFVEGISLYFNLGWCFWLTLISGLLCVIVGSAISIIDFIYPHKFSTLLEMDYGTPFDRHTIIEDSHETKKKKKNGTRLEEPNLTVGFGGLLRRLSKRDRDKQIDPNPHGHRGNDNYAFEIEAPKSPWRYPHLMFRSDSRKNKSVSFKGKSNREDIDIFAHNHNFLKRQNSKDSTCSSLSSIPHDIRSIPPFQEKVKQFKRTDSSESSNSSLASFGAIFGRSNSRKKNIYNKNFQKSNLTNDGYGGVTQESMFDQIDKDHQIISIDNLAPNSLRTIHKEVKVGSSVVIEGNESLNKNEVEIVVGGRKNSTTKAIRRNSAENQRSEASMW